MRRDRTDFIRRSSHLLLASTMLLGSGVAFAQDSAPPEPSDTAAESRAAAQDDDTIVVTAQRREENLQDVPIAITAITTKTLDDLQVDAFDDYARLVPSLSYKSAGPGTSNVYFRGVASGENANHSASLPSVGTYLDEQPITTIQGALDIHVFDIARVEALAGPQGTLYGASSQAGTIRIITNKPDTSAAYGEANVEVNKVAHGGWGYTGEGFINLPVSSRAALRVVGWYRRDAGYIDNVEGELVFPLKYYDEGCDCLIDDPGDEITFDNHDLAEDNYNDADTVGARAALRIELDDSWTVTPSIVAQKQVSNGSFAVERGLGDLETMQFNPERLEDKWVQAALTVEGKIANFDVTYAGSYMKRQIDGAFDYADYAYFYDALAGYGVYFYADDGSQVNPNQYVESDDSFTKMAHELRFTSPADKRVRLVGGLFYQRQTHNIEQHYIIDGISADITVPGTEDNIWLTKQLRVDRDYAVFGEVAFDITPQLTVTGGGRLYKFDNSLVGFFGYNYIPDDGIGFSTNPDYECQGPSEVDGSPCTNVDKRKKDSGFLHRLNLIYKPNADALFYATWSKGYRPGGVNRRGSRPPYDADFITNYELGMKLSFMNDRLRFNAAAYRLDWSDIQLSFLGANGLTEVVNAGNARIHGVEFDFYARPMTGLTFNAGASFNNAKIRNDYCALANKDFDCTTAGNELLADKGTRLPLTAKFKGNVRARYEWPVGTMRAHVQATGSYEGKRSRDLRQAVQDIYGNMDGYSQWDLNTGLKSGPWSAELFAKNIFDTRGQLSKSIQCPELTCGDPDGLTAIGGKVYTTVNRPRTIGLRFGRTF